MVNKLEKIYTEDNLDIYFVKTDEKRKDTSDVLKNIYKNLGEEILIVREKYHRPKNVKSKYNYSITYVNDGAFIAFGKGNFAIDAEEIRPYDKNINKILKIKPKDENEFFEFFTQKEALIKLNDLMLTNILDALNGKVKSISYKNYIISIAKS